MEETLTFSDIFKKSFLESGGLMQNLTVSVFARAAAYILLSVILGVLLYILYQKTYSGVVYSRSFAFSILGMTVLTCAIIVTIQSNTVLSLGMVGALSIVRYRTAVKDPVDLLYLFWAVASGIATGAGMFLIALFVFLVMAAILLIVNRLKGKRDEMYILLVHYSGDGIDEKIRRVVSAMTKMIHDMGMKIVSEGVETDEQMQGMLELGVDYIQGFCFSRPVPQDVLLQFIKQHNSGGQPG